jgi:hypothetical protein
MVLFSAFHLRARVSFLSTLTLGNYSEFALIVAAVAFEAGWLTPEWLVALAVTVALSFCLSAPLNAKANSLFLRWRGDLQRLESPRYLKEDRPIPLDEARVLIFGMGRVGSAAFLNVASEDPESVIGFDIDNTVVDTHYKLGRNVLRGDANNPELWTKLKGFKTQIGLIVLATPYQQSNLSAIALLRAEGYRKKIATIAFYPDDEMALYAAGADSVYNIYQEAGDGIAQEIEHPPEGRADAAGCGNRCHLIDFGRVDPPGPECCKDFRTYLNLFLRPDAAHLRDLPNRGDAYGIATKDRHDAAGSHSGARRRTFRRRDRERRQWTTKAFFNPSFRD